MSREDEILRYEEQIEICKQKLANDMFVQRAPSHVVEAERKKLRDFKSRLSACKSNMIVRVLSDVTKKTEKKEFVKKRDVYDSSELDIRFDKENRNCVNMTYKGMYVNGFAVPNYGRDMEFSFCGGDLIVKTSRDKKELYLKWELIDSI